MGTEKFYEYIHKFGFGSTTGIDYSSDGAGILRAAKYAKDVDLAPVLGFGQSIAVTPLQMITAAWAAVNGGVRYTPRLVSHTEDSEGNTVQSFEAGGRRTRSSRKKAPRRSDRSCKAWWITAAARTPKIAGYSVGGQTGTAQMYENGARLCRAKTFPLSSALRRWRIRNISCSSSCGNRACR